VWSADNEVDRETISGVGLAEGCGLRLSCDRQMPSRNAHNAKAEVHNSSPIVPRSQRCFLPEKDTPKVEIQQAYRVLIQLGGRMSKSLRILVPVKRVIDYAVSINHSQFRSSSHAFIMPYVHTIMTFPGVLENFSTISTHSEYLPDQTPSQQIQHWHRNRWRKALAQPLR
jgi:hypothetical protein